MIVSEQHKLLFLHNPKTAGVSIGRWLVENTFARRVAYEHSTAAEGRLLLGDNWDNYFKFGFVRNPWSRLASWWKMIEESPEREKTNPLWVYARQNAHTFSEFVLRCTESVRTSDGSSLDSFARPQLDYFTDSSGRMLVNFIGRYENLEVDWEGAIRSKIVFNNRWRRQPSLSRLNVDKSNTGYRNLYNEELRGVVADRFSKDIEFFKYEF